MSVQVVHCERCGAPCKHDPQRNPDARLLRHSKTPDGLCAACALTKFLKHTEPLATIIAEKGPAILLNPAVAAQAARVLAAGNSDAEPGEVNWEALVDWWEFPS